ncbi:MAG: sigma 54-interacting transcriptional regulator [Deltaproteobacteria bacterium]|nr:sigma 54-interacting transcriptional regulator [Deltaproteobacteria bacterium]
MADTTFEGTRRLPPKVSLHEILIVFSPDARWVGKRIVLAGAMAVGREGEGDDLVIHDRVLSRRHGRFEVGSGRKTVSLSDLASRNGTFRNGARIGDSSVALESGDVVRAGDTLFVYRCVDKERPAGTESSNRLVGSSEAIQSVLRDVARVAVGDLSVLVIGETGTGKELIAREIHERSKRTGRLVPVNCAAIPRDLFESAFFGHKKGSFSGAIDDQEGYFQSADGGTLFLDEIGEMPIGVQAKLLRALETKEIIVVGSTKPRAVDVAVVAATNRPLDEEVEAGRFRADLLARIDGVTIRLPALRHRREDILTLFQHFLTAAGRSIVMNADFAEAVVAHAWPQNVRQLENMARRIAIDSKDGQAVGRTEVERWLPAAKLVPTRDAWAAPPDGSRPEGATSAGVGEVASPDIRSNAPPRDEVEAAVRDAAGNIAAVAGHFKTNRQQIYRWLRYYGLKAKDLRTKTS